MKNKDTKQKINSKAKTAWIVVAVIVLLCVALLASFFFYSKYEKAKATELPEGFVTYNASRYFFRFDRPSDWLVTNQSNGFLLDDDLGLVCKMNPTILSENSEESVLYDSVELDFFYRQIEDYNNFKITYTEVANEFKNLISGGNLFPEITENVTFGVENLEAVENSYNELCAIDFSTMLGENEFRGTMYLAKRTKAYYCVLVSYENQDDYNMFKADIQKVVESFRMTVLED